MNRLSDLEIQHLRLLIKVTKEIIEAKKKNGRNWEFHQKNLVTYRKELRYGGGTEIHEDE